MFLNRFKTVMVIADSKLCSLVKLVITYIWDIWDHASGSFIFDNTVIFFSVSGDCCYRPQMT